MVSFVYGAGGAAVAMGESMPQTANSAAQGIISVLSIAVNIVVFAIILRRAKQQKKNPYTNEIFTDQKDFRTAMARAQ